MFPVADNLGLASNIMDEPKTDVLDKYNINRSSSFEVDCDMPTKG